MYPRIICVALAMFTVVLLPADVDTARRSKPRFKIIERTYDAEPFISVAGIALATRYPDTIDVHGPRDSRTVASRSGTVKTKRAPESASWRCISSAV
jgi:hypothetical protein